MEAVAEQLVALVEEFEAALSEGTFRLHLRSVSPSFVKPPNV